MSVTRVAIVTGAGGDIGRATAMALAADGYAVIAADVDDDGVAATVDAITGAGGTGSGAHLDVTDRDDAIGVVESAASIGTIAVLVNGAGSLRPTPVIDIDESEWNQVVAVNLTGTFLCSQAVLAPMREAGWGRIINLSSTAGKNVSTVGGAHYTAAKAGVLGFTRHLAKEEAAHGITVNAVCPGLIDTKMVRNTITADRQQAYADSFPISRLGTADEVASLIGFLASDRAAYITGASLDINGGDLMI